MWLTKNMCEQCLFYDYILYVAYFVAWREDYVQSFNFFYNFVAS